MGKVKDLIGKRFGRLTVLSFSHVNVNKKRIYNCVCSCGSHVKVIGASMLNGTTKSCGCIVREGESKKTHGMCGTRIYRIWANMKSRCLNKKVVQYKNYGGKGIYIQKSWLTFNNFYKDNYRKYNAAYKKYGKETQIDRINNDGPYSIENVRWTSRIVNCNNKSTHTVFYIKGKRYTLSELARLHNINSETLSSRLESGIPFKHAISIPLFSRKLLNLVRTGK